jgi:hypothetical protein
VLRFDPETKYRFFFTSVKRFLYFVYRKIYPLGVLGKEKPPGEGGGGKL